VEQAPAEAEAVVAEGDAGPAVAEADAPDRTECEAVVQEFAAEGAAVLADLAGAIQGIVGDAEELTAADGAGTDGNASVEAAARAADEEEPPSDAGPPEQAPSEAEVAADGNAEAPDPSECEAVVQEFVAEGSAVLAGLAGAIEGIVGNAEELTAADGAGTDGKAVDSPAAQDATEAVSDGAAEAEGRGDLGLAPAETKAGGEASAEPAPPDGSVAEGDGSAPEGSNGE
jgi:hypothetical protein